MALLTALPLLLHLLVIAVCFRFGPPLKRPIAPERINSLGGVCVALLLLWQLKAAINPLLPLHFLGLSCLTLMAGGRGALIGGTLITLISALWHQQYHLLAVDLLTLVSLPVMISRTALFVVRALLPGHLFLYIFVAGFLGGALGLSGGLAARALLLASQELVTWPQAMAQGIELLPLLAFPEGLMNGMAVTLMAVYRPQWLATFDERKFLN